MPPPYSFLVAPEWCAVEPLVHAPKTVEAARVGRVGVIDNAVLERERADARSLTRVRRRISSRHCRDRGDRRIAAERAPLRLASIVVLDAAFALLFFGEADVEVVVEVSAE